MRYCGIYNQNELDSITIKEYALRMRAYSLAKIDSEHELHMQAWLNEQVGATVNEGTKNNPDIQPYYKSFKDFYDYESRLAQANGEEVSEKNQQGEELPTIDPKLLELIKKV